MKLNKPIIQKWIRALRSGRYKQTRKFLRSDGKYCCLGVLCNIVKPQVKGKWYGSCFKVKDNGDEFNLPVSVQNFAGVSNSLHDSCVTWNDEQNMNFKEIAQKLEDKLNQRKKKNA